jgi:hypothetical protein
LGGAYTFGDGDIQAQRLSVLDDVFGPASRRLLGEVVTEQPAQMCAGPALVGLNELPELQSSNETGQITWGLHQAAYERPH